MLRHGLPPSILENSPICFTSPSKGTSGKLLAGPGAIVTFFFPAIEIFISLLGGRSLWTRQARINPILVVSASVVTRVTSIDLVFLSQSICNLRPLSLLMFCTEEKELRTLRCLTKVPTSMSTVPFLQNHAILIFADLHYGRAVVWPLQVLTPSCLLLEKSRS